MYSDMVFLNMSLYDFFGTISTLFLLIVNFSLLKHKKLFLSGSSQSAIKYFSEKSKIKWLSSVTFWAAVETLLISFVQYAPTSTLNQSFGDYMKTGANYFGFILFIPFILVVLFFLISVNPLKQMDIITPAFPVALAFVKIGCFCAGCCHGIECSFGLYNNNTKAVEFPVQLVEVGLALLIFIFLLLYRKKAKDGTLFPIYLILYSGTRFFSEFLRHEPEVFWKLKTYHILCIIGVILGVLELIIALIFGDKISSFFAEYSAIKGFSFIFSEIRFKYLKIKKKIMKRDAPIVHHKKYKKKNQKKMKNRK